MRLLCWFIGHKWEVEWQSKMFTDWHDDRCARCGLIRSVYMGRVGGYVRPIKPGNGKSGRHVEVIYGDRQD